MELQGATVSAMKWGEMWMRRRVSAGKTEKVRRRIDSPSSERGGGGGDDDVWCGGASAGGGRLGCLTLGRGKGHGWDGLGRASRAAVGPVREFSKKRSWDAMVSWAESQKGCRKNHF
jgi:hypothetical protein